MINLLQVANSKKERNYGIDLLRIVSMFFIVILHSLGQGGILNNALLNSNQYKISWFMEICAFCAVDIFAIISGYVSYREEDKPVKYSNYINLWLEVVFYGVIITLIFNIINPQMISSTSYITAMFPVVNDLYWYFTAYTALFFVMPLLNRGIRACGNSSMKKISIAIFVLFSIFGTVFSIFNLNNGYSFVWIMLLYIIGATLKKCEIGKKIKSYKAVIGILILYIVTYLYKIYGFEFSSDNINITKDLLVSYTSPTILGASILYVIWFSKIKFKNILQKIIKFVAPSAFAIYLINTNKLVWEHIMKDLFIDISNQSSIKIILYVIGFSTLFVLGSILIDKIRQLIFKICHIEDLTTKISNKINKVTI